MPISQAQRDEYFAQGFTIIDEFFDAAEVAIMRKELGRLVEAGKLRNVATEGDGQTHSQASFNLQVCPLSPVSEVLRTLPFAEKVVSVVEQLIDTPAHHRLDQIFLKPAKHGAGTGWHQDNGYFVETQGMASYNGFGMWIALHDATVANGTMQLIPNMHEQVLEHVRDGSSDHHVTCAASIDESEAVPVEVRAGGIALFNYGVPHCTKANMTDADRAGLALHFLRATSVAAANEKANGVRGPLINGPDCAGGQEQWGVDLRGAWEALVKEELSLVS